MAREKDSGGVAERPPERAPSGAMSLSESVHLHTLGVRGCESPRGAACAVSDFDFLKIRRNRAAPARATAPPGPLARRFSRS